MSKDRRRTVKAQRRENSEIGPEDLELLRRLLRFYPGIEEMLILIRRLRRIGFPINSFADLEDGLGGPEVTIKVGGQDTPLRVIRRSVPMHYFPIASESDLMAKLAEVRRRAASAAARRSRDRIARRA